MFQWSIPILFLILPFAVISPGLIWKAQQLFFLTIPLFAIALSLKNPWIRAFLVYAGIWQLGIFCYSFNHPAPGPGPGLSVILSLMAAAVVYKLVSESKLGTEIWYGVIRIAVMIQVGICLFQFFSMNPVAWLFSFVIKVKQLLPDHLVGSIGNRNYLASFVIVSLPMFINWRMGFFLPFIAFIAVFCPSPASLAGICGGIFYFAFARYGSPGKVLSWGVLGVLASAGFTAAYVLSTGYHLWEFQALPGQLAQFWRDWRVDQDIFRGDLGRFGMWLMALGHLFRSVPGMVLGFGPGAFWGREYPLHSEYVAMWFYFGLIGMFLLLCYIRETWRFLWKSKNRVLLTSFLILCVDSVANFPFEIATTGMMGTIILGLIERERLNG